MYLSNFNKNYKKIVTNIIVSKKIDKNYYSAACDNSSLYFLNSSLATALL